MPEQMNGLLKKYAAGIHNIYGNSLKAVILYGSYARGDYTKDSDVDIMVLVDQTEQEIVKSRSKVSDYTYDFNEEHELMIMPVVKAIEHFQYWLPVYPFYQNVEREGVSLYVA